MKIGIISDTHDNVEDVIKATRLFKKKKVDFVVHCGDMVAPKTINFFKGIKLEMVLGNCDGDIETIKKNLANIGGKFLGEVGKFTMEGKRFLVYHGTDKVKLDKFIKAQRNDYVLTGHTHKVMDKTIGITRVLNPGGHYYKDTGTVMLLTDMVEVRKL